MCLAVPGSGRSLSKAWISAPIIPWANASIAVARCVIGSGLSLVVAASRTPGSVEGEGLRLEHETDFAFS
jgi:hypothetical protein